MKYEVDFRRHENPVETTTIEGADFEEALENWCEQCLEEDDTGIFFDMVDANPEALKKNKNFYTISTQGGDYGVILKDVRPV